MTGEERIIKALRENGIRSLSYSERLLVNFIRMADKEHLKRLKKAYPKLVKEVKEDYCKSCKKHKKCYFS